MCGDFPENSKQLGGNNPPPYVVIEGGKLTYFTFYEIVYLVLLYFVLGKGREHIFPRKFQAVLRENKCIRKSIQILPNKFQAVKREQVY